MDVELKILLVEDLPSDAELDQREITKAFINSRFKRVETRNDFISALNEFLPDVIVSDYSMPSFNGLQALELSLSMAPDIPFIVYTGSLNEDIAVACMKAGATDYVLKEYQKRLVPAIQRALEIKKIKQERVTAHQALVESEFRFRQLLDSVDNISVYGCHDDGFIHYWNKASEMIYGFSSEEAIGNNVLDLIVPDDKKADARQNIKDMLALKKRVPSQEILLKRKGGGSVPVFSNYVIVSPPGKKAELFCIDIDLSERNKALGEVKLNELRLNSLVEILQKQYKDANELLVTALNEAVKITDSQVGFLLNYEDKSRLVAFDVSSGNAKMDGTVNYDLCFQLTEIPAVREMLNKGIPVMVNSKDSDFLNYAEITDCLRKLSGFLIIPVILDNDFVAVVGVAGKPSEYFHGDVLQLTLLMNSVWKILYQKNKEQELRFLSGATEQSPLSVIITDTTGVIQFVNNKFVSTTKYDRDDLKGRCLRLFKPGHLPDDSLNDMLAHLQNGQSWKGEVQNSKSTGNTIWEEVNVSTIKNNQGDVTHYLVLSQDITERKKMELDLLAAKEKAEENDRLKTAFLNNLSHEIRTPLNAIMGYSQLVGIPGQEMEQVSKYADFILQGSQQLVSIMDSIIAMAIIETGQLKINPVKSSLSKILNVVYNQLKYQADKKGIALQTSAFFSRYEADVLIDETKVIQILSNLVENAIKYTDSGYVKFGCSVNETAIHFFIEDTGSGISNEMIPLVFERFRQGDKGSKSLQEGLGLGLSISKSYVEAMGGNIQVHSEVNKGSRFAFYIPYKSYIGDLTTQTFDSAISFAKQITILVVDDVEMNALLINEFVEPFNISVVYAASGQEALKIVNDNTDIDLVLMDIKMPGMDGYTATRAIKNIRPDLPVVAQTAYALAGDRLKSIEAGCDDYLPKPVTRNALFAVIKKVVKTN